MTNDLLIVTGAAGFIGCNIVRALNARGCENILAVDWMADQPAKAANLDAIRYAEFMEKDAFRDAVKNNALPACSALIHMGACSSTTVTDEAFVMDNNFEFTRELCEWSLAQGVRFIYASSGATYGDGSRGFSDAHDLIPSLEPLNLYGRSKQRFDLWALESGHLDRIVGLKYFNVYGPREDHKGDMRSVVNKAYRQILEAGELKLFKSYRPEYEDGKQERDFIYVNDAADMTLFFLDHPDVSGIFNCGRGKARTWLDLAQAVFAAMDREPNIVFIDMPDSIRDKYQYHTQADMTKLRTAGYTTPPTELEDGIREYVRDYLAKH